MKKLIVTLLKISLSVAILGYLFWDAFKKGGDESFRDMVSQPKRWELLAAALALTSFSLVLTLIRWCYLVRALGIPFPMRDAFRIGFLGCLFNLAPMGIVGGDLLKGVMLAREHPGNRTKSAASVIVDRVIGLYVLFIVATVGIFATGFWGIPEHRMHLICQGVVLVTAVSTLGIAVILLPGVMDSRFVASLAGIRRIGPVIGKATDAVQMYRRNLPVLLLASLLTVGVHLAVTISLSLIAAGLQFTTVPFSQYFAIYPTSAIASTIPLPAGPLESAIVFLYASAMVRVSHALAWEQAKAQGFIIALVLRIISILVAAFGIVYYLAGRREVAEVMHEAEEGDSRD